MKNLFLRPVASALVFCLACAGTVRAAETGTVAGMIEVYKTEVKTHGAKSFKDVVVYLEPLTPAAYPPPQEHAVMDQRGLVFIPHMLAVQKGATVDFLNSDNDRHNVYFLYDNTGETLDIGTWGPGEKVSHTFKETGLVISLCQLHLEMAAYILVLNYPFFTVAEIDGETQCATYEIRGVPPGDYLLKAWHKKLKMKTGDAQVTVATGQTATLDFKITKAKYAD